VGNFIWTTAFIKFENDYELALKIMNGMRPKIVPGTPLEYKELIELWDANRSYIITLRDTLVEMNKVINNFP
jgi:hypothetical protein